MRYNFAADSFYIMKLCSRLFVLYCRRRPKDDKSSHFDPHFEQVRGGVEPWWMARWKAGVELLLSVIELPFLSLGDSRARVMKLTSDAVPAYTVVTILLRSCGGAQTDSMACIDGYVTPCSQPKIL